LENRHFRDIEPVDRDAFHGLRHFADAAGERRLELWKGAAVIDGAEGFEAASRAAGQDDRGSGTAGGVQQIAQECGGEFGHVAGDDQVPVRRGVMQGGEDSAERTLIGVTIGDAVEFAVADEGDIAGGEANLGGDGLHEGNSVEREPGLVAAHTGTAPPCQHISRASHSEMITLGLLPSSCRRDTPVVLTSSGPMKRENILRDFCFRLVLSTFIAGAVFAAGSERPQHFTSVVRSDQRTGKLVRSMIVSPKAVAEQRIAETVVPAHVLGTDTPVAAPEPTSYPAGIDEAVERIAAEHSLPPQLIHSVIKVESNYNPRAISNKGALGLMQLIPSTARRFGVADVFNPIQNIQGGAKYLRYLLDLFDGSYPLALAAYNAGEAAVVRYGGIPPFAETQNYVVLVRKHLEQAKKEAAAKAAAKPAPVIEAAQTGPAHVVEEVQADGTVRYVSR
jgi:hypothetical protein